jgi:hypothetical protein
MTDEREITTLMQRYFDGLYEGDTDKLGTVFHPTCFLTYAQDGKLVSIARDDWFQAINNRAKPKDTGLARHDDIVSIDCLDAHTALAKVTCAIPPRFFIDLLSLLKIDGCWQVVQKVSAVSVR